MNEDEIIGEERVLTNLVDSDKALVVITIACSRSSDGGYPSDGAIGVARETMKSFMQSLGCTVNATSTAIIIPETEIAENDVLIAEQAITFKRHEVNE